MAGKPNTHPSAKYRRRGITRNVRRVPKTDRNPRRPSLKT